MTDPKPNQTQTKYHRPITNHLSPNYQPIAGKFIVGFTATGTVAIPSLLYHAGKIAHGALWMELAAVAMVGGALAGYDWWSERRGGGGFYSGF